MFVPFAALPPASRVWIFQSNRPFSAEELKLIESRLQNFTNEWAVHGSPLPTSFTIRYDQFIVLAADDSHQSASGCSIDSSVRVLKELEQLLNVQLFDRNQVAFYQEGQVILVPVQKLKQNFQDGILKENILTFNNLVAMKSAFETTWMVPAAETWLKRYIPNQLANVK